MRTGERILMLRKERAISRRELSISSGVSETAIKQYETNKRQPRTAQLTKLATALETTPAYLMGWDESTPLEYGMTPYVEKAANFAACLKYYLMKSEKTPMLVAAELNISQRIFADWYHARKLPSLANTELLANYFGIAVSDLLTPSNEVNNYYLKDYLGEAGKRKDLIDSLTYEFSGMDLWELENLLEAFCNNTKIEIIASIIETDDEELQHWYSLFQDYDKSVLLNLIAGMDSKQLQLAKKLLEAIVPASDE